MLNKCLFSISLDYDGSFCLGEGSYNAEVKDDPTLYLISFVNFEAQCLYRKRALQIMVMMTIMSC